jgi:hypothetical protein
MENRFGGRSFGSHQWLSEHEPLGSLFGNHHHGGLGLGYAFGTRGDDVLTGTDHRDFIIGLSGDDTISGGGGKDWIYGGKGEDLLDGGADGDKVFAGDGNDVATYVLAENVSANTCGKETHDFYDGGKGFDVLQLILTSEEIKSQAVQDDIDAFRAFLVEHGSACGSDGSSFEFKSFDLTVSNFEDLQVVGGNTPPHAEPDSYSTPEDTPLNIPMIVTDPVTGEETTIPGVLANDSDADNDPLTAIFIDDEAHRPMHGTLSLNDDGSFSYVPEQDFFGTDAFTYVLSDGIDQVETSVAIEVTPVNDPPQLKDANSPPPVWQVTEGTTETFPILDYYVPGPENEWEQQTLSLQFAFALSGNGTASGTADDQIQYQAFALDPSGATASDFITYNVFDGVDGVTSGLLNVEIVPAPVLDDSII